MVMCENEHGIYRNAASATHEAYSMHVAVERPFTNTG